MPLLLCLAAAALLHPQVTGPPDERAPDLAARLHRIVPDDALLAVRVRRVCELVAERETSRWIDFALAPEWQASALELRDHDGPEPGEASARAKAAVAELVASLADATDLVAFASLPESSASLPDSSVATLPDSSEPSLPESSAASLPESAADPGRDVPTLVLALVGGDRAGAALRAFVDGAAPARAAEGVELLWGGTGVAEAYLRRGELHLIVSAVDAESAASAALAALARLDASDERGDVPIRLQAGARVQAIASLARAGESLLPERLRSGLLAGLGNALRSIAWVHAAVEPGAGERIDLVIEAPYAGTRWAEEAARCFGPPAPSLLELAPARADGVLAGRLDFARLVEAMIDELARADSRAREVADAVFAFASVEAEVDVRRSLLGGLTGDWIAFHAPRSGAAAAEREPHRGLVDALEGSCVAFGIRDPEPFVTALEALLSKIDVECTSSSLPGAEIWTIDAESLDVTLAVHPSFLCVALDAGALASFLARADGDEGAEPSFFADPPRAETERPHGWIVAFAPSRLALELGAHSIAAVATRVAASSTAHARTAGWIARAASKAPAIAPASLAGSGRGTLSGSEGVLRLQWTAR